MRQPPPLPGGGDEGGRREKRHKREKRQREEKQQGSGGGRQKEQVRCLRGAGEKVCGAMGPVYCRLPCLQCLLGGRGRR